MKREKIIWLNGDSDNNIDANELIQQFIDEVIDEDNNGKFYIGDNIKITVTVEYIPEDK